MKSELKFLKQNPVKVPKTPCTVPGAGAGMPRTATRNTGDFAWKSVAPKAGEAHEKTVKGKDYIYCPHHGDTKWALKISLLAGIEHKTGCRKMAEANAQAAAGTPDRMTAAVANISEEEGDEENI
jgi:hypothetical protein